jgi:hypothetical protein
MIKIGNIIYEVNGAQPLAPKFKFGLRHETDGDDFLPICHCLSLIDSMFANQESADRFRDHDN